MKFCECGCGQIPKSPRSRFCLGHGNRTADVKKKISENNCNKRPEVLEKKRLAITGRWCAASGKSPEEIQELKDKFQIAIENSRCRKDRRERNGGFLSSWEKRVAEFLTLNGISRCFCSKFYCSDGWHYERRREFWYGRRYYPDFVYKNVTVEVVGTSYLVNPSKCEKRMMDIVRSGFIVCVITSKGLLPKLQTSPVFQEEIGIPTFTLDRLDKLLNFLEDTSCDGIKPYPFVH